MGHLDEYMRKMAVVNATELLLGSGRPPLYRALDQLLPLPGEGALADTELHKEMEQLLDPDEWQSLHEDQHAAFNVTLTSGHRIRGACHLAAHGLTVKLSLLGPQSDHLQDLEIPKILQPLLEAESGLIIVTGPATSGKTTLIARLISQIASHRSTYVATSENPVEYNLQSGNSVAVQRSVGRHCTSHAQALDSALASHAQIIACSELTAKGALERMLEAACTGSLAIGELQGLGTIRALEELLNTIPRPTRSQLSTDLSESLLAVVALDLIPKKTGGRTLATEVLLSSRNVCSLIREGKLNMLPTLLDREPGMQSMDRCLLDLATKGLIEGREAYVRATDKRAFSSWS